MTLIKRPKSQITTVLTGIAAAAGFGVIASLAVTSVTAQEYPERPLRVIVPFAPGGGSDSSARLLAEPLSEALNQSVVIENHAGAGGSVGIGMAAKAEADGYTLLVASNALAINPSLAKNQTYDPLADFAFISGIGESPNILVANPEAGISNVEELRERAASDPNGLFYSTAGVGTSSHLTGETLKLRADLNINHAPYSGAGPAVQAVLGGEVPIAISSLSAVISHIEAGTLIGILQTGEQPWPTLDNVPTVTEAGLPEDTTTAVFQAVYAPAGTPQPILERLEEEVVAILENEEMQAKLLTAGFLVSHTGSEALQAKVESDLAKYAEVIEKAGIPAR